MGASQDDRKQITRSVGSNPAHWPPKEGKMIDPKEICGCGHLDKEHWALGCTQCNCPHFISWEEIDAETDNIEK
jgi:hypothetical protein